MAKRYTADPPTFVQRKKFRERKSAHCRRSSRFVAFVAFVGSVEPPPPQASLPCRGAPEVQRFKEAASHPKAQSCNDCFSERDVQHVEGMECPPGLSYNPVQRFPPRRMEPDCEEEHGDMPEDHRACHAVLPHARLSLDRFRAADHLVHLEEDRLSTIIIAAEAFRAFDLKIKGRGRLDLSPSPLFTFNNTD